MTYGTVELLLVFLHEDTQPSSICRNIVVHVFHSSSLDRYRVAPSFCVRSPGVHKTLHHLPCLSIYLEAPSSIPCRAGELNKTLLLRANDGKHTLKSWMKVSSRTYPSGPAVTMRWVGSSANVFGRTMKTEKVICLSTHETIYWTKRETPLPTQLYQS